MSDLSDSHLVSEISTDCENIEAMPVLIGDEVWAAKYISGGYDEEGDVHVVELSVPKDSWGRPNQTAAFDYEVHSENYAWHLSVPQHDIQETDTMYHLRLGVTDYERIEVSFEEELKEDIDKRETQYEK